MSTTKMNDSKIGETAEQIQKSIRELQKRIQIVKYGYFGIKQL